MGNDVIKMLRYNTGTDKKAFVKFKDDFNAVVFNATIVAYSGAAVADLVSVHKNQYIIDPQTHIMQHDIHAIMSKNSKTGQYAIKKSVKKYLDQLPPKVTDIIEGEGRHLSMAEITEIVDELVESVYEFETAYVNSFIENKEYDKYLKYAKVGPTPKVIIAPYFMLKRDMSIEECVNLLELNVVCVEKTFDIQKAKGTTYPIAAQLVLDREIFKNDEVLKKISEKYANTSCEYIFIWISDFSTWECSYEEKLCFYRLLSSLNLIGKKPVMSYGGYDSIFLCHSQLNVKLYGVAQSVGYGEARPITPVGGGLPVNKYYFGPLHQRMRFDEALSILIDNGYFDETKTNMEHAMDYYQNICDCEKCHDVVQDDIDNFEIYNESVPYIVKARFGDITRNRPTTEATLVAAFHFLFNKKMEWGEIETRSLEELTNTLIHNYEKYGSDKQLENIKEWCEIFAR